MLAPKRVKYRKQMKGRMTGAALRGSAVSFGDYGLQALECWMAHCATDRGRTYNPFPLREENGKALDQGVSRQADHEETG